MSTAIAQQLALVFMGRALDTQWASATANLLNGGQPSAALQAAFYNSAVAEGVFHTNDSPSELVNHIFQNIFGFNASSFEQTAWGNLITNGTLTKETAAWTIFKSYLGATNVPDAYKLPAQSKLVAMNAYSEQLVKDAGANLALSGGGDAAASARSFVQGVNTQASAASAIATVPTAVAALPSASAPTYTLTSSAASVDEGGAVNFTLATTHVAAGTQQAYTITGVNSADVVDGSLSGVATIGADGKATISVTLAADAKTEGAETLTVSVAGKTASVTVNDTSTAPVPTYALAADAASVNEGGTATFVLATTNVAAGSSFDYTITGVSAADVTGGKLSGTAVVGADGKAVISVGTVADSLTEGAETMTVAVAGKSASTIVNDTSTAPVPTYALAADAASVNEGGTATFTLTTTNVAAGSKFDYTLSGVSAADVVGGALAGTATVGADGKAIVAVTLAADATTEGAETLTMAVAGKSASTIVNDTSTTPVPTYALAADAASVNEGGTALFTLTTTNVAANSYFDYVISGVSASDVVGGLIGTAMVGADGKAMIQVALAADATTEGAETLTVTVAGKTASTTVNDTSTSAFVLQGGVDMVVGTAYDDNVYGTAYYGGVVAVLTYNSGDQIDGGAGTDTINLTVEGELPQNGASLPVPAVTGVEVFNLRAVASFTQGHGLAADAQFLPGLTAFNVDRSTTDVSVNNLASNASVGIIGNGALQNGNVEAGYANAATAAVVNISGGTTGGDVTLTGGDLLKSTILNSTGAANTIGNTKGAVTTTSTTINASTALKVYGIITNTGSTLTVAGKGAVDIAYGQLEAGVTKLDAKNHSGGLTAFLGTADNQVVTTGSGNDVIFTGGVLKTGTVDAGAGTDTLVVFNAADVATAALGAKYTSFETINIKDSQNVSYVSGITAVELNGMTAATVSGLSATQANAITVLDNQATSLTLTLADATGSADSVSLALKGTNTLANVSVAGLSVIGVETLNISATTGTAGTPDAITLGAGGATTLKAVNISGTADVSFDGTQSAKAITLNSTTTGIATILGNFKDGSTITTGGGKDVITLGTGFGTYNSGAGNDKFNATTAQLNTGIKYNTINAGDGTDTLNITDAAAFTLTDSNFAKITGVEKITIVDTTTNAQSITSGGFFDTNFKAGGVDLTTASTSGKITVDMNMFSGAATVKATTTLANGDIAITTGTAGGVATVTTSTLTGKAVVTTGSADDVVSVTSSGTSGSNVISTGAGNDTITVTTAAASTSSITGGSGADKITLGAGTETIVIGNAESGITVATADRITGFTSGTDALKLGFAGVAFTGNAGNYNEGVAVVADFAAALAAANVQLAAIKAATSATDEYYSFQWDTTNGYLFDDTNADGVADQVIILAGLTGGTFGAGDIIA